MRRLAAIVLLLSLPLAARADCGFLRFPAISRDRIAFVARDALWVVDRRGGTATRLLGGPGAGRVLLPRFSPDGRLIALTLVHGTTSDVEVVPTAGGAARRLTFVSTDGLERGAPDNLVLGWTPDGRRVVFLSRRWAADGWTERPALVGLNGDLPAPLSLDHAGFAAIAPDGRTLAWSGALHDFEPMLRYDGGQREDLAELDLASGHLTALPPGRGNDTQPMWVGGQLFFLSDRGADRRLNIWAFDVRGRHPREVTHVADHDLRFPSAGPGGIVFESDGAIWRLDPTSGRAEPVPITLSADATAPHPHEVATAGAIRVLAGGQYPALAQNPDFALSPDGTHAAFSARGALVVLARAGGPPVTIAGGSDEDADHPAFSPDGGRVAFTTDRTGEEELAIAPADGRGPVQILTHVARGELYTPVFSPDGRTLAVPDADHALALVPTIGGAAAEVARDPGREIRDAAFSPDGGFLAWSTHDATGLATLHLHTLATGRETVVAAPLDGGGALPCFDATGDLIFVAEGGGKAVVSAATDRGLAFVHTDVLRRAVLAPDGEVRDVATLAAPAAAIAGLAVRGDTAIYLAAPEPTLGGPLPGERSALHAFDLARGTDRVVRTGVAAFVVSGDGRRVLARDHGGWWLLDVASGAGAPLDVAALHETVDPRAEWAEMFAKSWRLERDLLIDRHVGGADWAMVRARAARELPRLGSRDDLNWLLTQALGALHSSHIVVQGGDDGPAPPTVAEARLLGADLVRDPLSGRVRIAHVLRTDPSQPALRSPLATAGIADGDLLLAIDGTALPAAVNPDAVLARAGTRTALLVQPGGGGADRTVTVSTLADDSALREADRVVRRRATVARLGQGRVGYIAVPDMAEAGAEQFARQFFPQAGDDALVVDVRGNPGGYLSPWLVERLSTATLARFRNRAVSDETLPPAGRPAQAATVALIDADSASDAEIFAWLFRRERLGLLVGARTWGGVRGFAGLWRLRDGGGVSVPFSALEGSNGRTLIEGHGVDPDVAVAASPLAGAPDAQLAAAVRLALAPPGPAATKENRP